MNIRRLVRDFWAFRIEMARKMGERNLGEDYWTDLALGHPDRDDLDTTGVILTRRTLAYANEGRD